MLRLKIPYYPLETPKTASLWADQRPVKIGREKFKVVFLRVKFLKKKIFCLVLWKYVMRGRNNLIRKASIKNSLLPPRNTQNGFAMSWSEACKNRQGKIQSRFLRVKFPKKKIFCLVFWKYIVRGRNNSIINASIKNSLLPPRNTQNGFAMSWSEACKNR